MISKPDNEKRTCNRCHHEQSVDEFNMAPNPKQPNRRNRVCKGCVRIYNNEYGRKKTAELRLLRARDEAGFLGLTVTITQRKKERFARDLECGVYVIDELLRSGVLDTPGVIFKGGEE